MTRDSAYFCILLKKRSVLKVKSTTKSAWLVWNAQQTWATAAGWIMTISHTARAVTRSYSGQVERGDTLTHVYFNLPACIINYITYSLIHTHFRSVSKCLMSREGVILALVVLILTVNLQKRSKQVLEQFEQPIRPLKGVFWSRPYHSVEKKLQTISS